MSVCLSVRPSGTKCSKELNLHLSLIVLFCLRSVSGQSQVCLRSVSSRVSETGSLGLHFTLRLTSVSSTTRIRLRMRSIVVLVLFLSCLVTRLTTSVFIVSVLYARLLTRVT